MNECKPLGGGGGGGAVRDFGFDAVLGRGLHSLTSKLNLSTFGHTLLTLELNLSTFGTHPRVKLDYVGDTVSLC